MHIHVVPPNLPGCGPLSSTLCLPLPERVKVIRRELDAAGIRKALAMGVIPTRGSDPLGVKSTLEVAAKMPEISAIGIMDPTKDPADREHFQRVEKDLQNPRVTALKGYLGYLHYEPAHANYRPYYELAEQHGLPVIFHTGDCYSAKAKLKYAHPLGVDEVAVDHPNCRFVIAHLGNPWMLDAAEVIYKNPNVWADVSGLVIGDGESLAAEEWDDTLTDIAHRVMYAMHYSERPNQFLYGSDWPLIPMRGYRQFIADMMPEEWEAMVFEENARMLFSRLG
jgi:predicted TIM-barrel fold metal-dependent hydrolase